MISKDKTYRTRDGREVRIYAVDGGGVCPIQGAYLHDNRWILASWTAQGMRTTDEELYDSDLIEVKPRIQREYWMNIYETNEYVGIYDSKALADAGANRSRIACIKITIDCEKGEGLE